TRRSSDLDWRLWAVRPQRKEPGPPGDRSRNGSLRPLQIRIMGRLEFDAQRRAVQLEGAAETGFQIAPVRVRNRVQRIAVDDDERRVLAALVRIAHLGAENTLAGRRLLLDGRLQ